MKIIAFAWTTAALLAGAKTVTRRNWRQDYARRWRAGEFAAAYDRSPRSRGRPVAIIRLVQATRLEPLADMPDSDFRAEGYAWLAEVVEVPRLGILGSTAEIRGRNAAHSFERWRRSGQSMWVVRFELVSRLHNLSLLTAKKVIWGVDEMRRRGHCFCRVCFCTDVNACPRGCSWIEEDRAKGFGLCSSCGAWAAEDGFYTEPAALGNPSQ